jgi:hypothetical protein
LGLIRLLYIAPSGTTMVLHLGVEKWHLKSEYASDKKNWEHYAVQHQASESASDVLSCLPDRQCAIHVRHDLIT